MSALCIVCHRHDAAPASDLCPECARPPVVGCATAHRHTPGPWVADGHRVFGPMHERSYHRNRRQLIAMLCDEAQSCDPTCSNGLLDEEGQANARLIAAAPDLLAALEYLLEQTVDADEAHGIALTEGEEEARNLAREAIRIATTPE